MGAISLTELRQNLFALADRVIETGEPLVIERRGVRLRLVRDVEQPPVSRLARLEPRSVTVGPPLRPDESPARWTELHADDLDRVAEPVMPPLTSSGRTARRRRR